MILSAQSIRAIRPYVVLPFAERHTIHGLSFGLGPASYDVRIAQDITLIPGGFALASTLESFRMPNDVAASVKDKSTWARRGLAVQNTFIDPGWEGFLTLELSNHHHVSWWPWWRTTKLDKEIADKTLVIPAGCPIAQIVFERLDAATELPYRGKYQNQPAGPQEPRNETERNRL